MFKVFVNDGTQEMPDDDILYIVCKEGVYLKKNVGVMESIAPVKGLSHLQSLETMARMNIKPIPARKFAQTIDFFKAVFEEHKAEAIVLPFYDIKKGEYYFVAPPQEVNGGSVDYGKGIAVEGMQMICSIHSHARMSAFHSGTDHDDESDHDGLHITIGDLDEEYVSISASIVANGTRFIVDPNEYINGLQLMVDVDEEVSGAYRKVYKMVKGKLVESPVKHTYKYRKYDKRFRSTCLKPQVEPRGIFPEEWMDNVTYKAYSYTYGGSAWGGAYSAEWWKDRLSGKDDKKKTEPVKALPPGKTKTTVIEDKTSEMNPCAECVFKAHKVDWVLEQIGNLVEDGADVNNFIPDFDLDDSGPLLDAYHCEKCNSVFQTEDLDPDCPVCKTGDHLIDVTGDVDFDDEVEDSDDVIDADFSQFDDGLTSEELETQPYQCYTCKKKFYLISQEECEYCGSPVLLSGEDQLENQSKSDAGDYLDKEFSDVMGAADEEITRLPIPGQDSIPINKKKDGVFTFMTRKQKKKRKKRGS